MKKLLFMVVLGFGVMQLKGNVSLTQDNQVRMFSKWSFPVPAAVQSSPIYGVLTTMMAGQLQVPAQARAATGYGQAGGAQPVRPAMPSVTNTNGTYNANSPSGGAASDQFGAVGKALH